ncbi:MAG TPA: T9SS type A sorting domain-containing protein [Bacteroidia bacterium]|nr:T9SS type A sorting domain-containing protein [Bacteroidia bacterium]
MKKITLIIFFLFTINFIYAQTNVSGGIFSNTTWTLAGSPYIVVDTIVVFPGVTLTIDPGVMVKFADGKYLEIREASLLATGTSTDSITFTSNSVTPTSGIWGRIWRNGVSMVSKYNYCNVKYSSQGIYGADTVKNSNFILNSFGCSAGYIDSCNFYNNGTGARGTIFNCNIKHNQTGVSGSFHIKNCQIDSNQTGVDVSLSLIENSSLSYNQIGGKSWINEDNRYKNCIINNNSIKGIELSGSGGDSAVNCQIKFNGIGIDITRGFSQDGILRNIIDSNSVGIKIGGSFSGGSIYCNKICNNTSFDLQLNSNINVNASNNYWCTPDSISTTARIYDGYDNISLGLVNFMPLDTSMCYLGLPTGIEVTKNKKLFSIYPNPVSDYLTVINEASTGAQISISNILGEKELSSIITSGKSGINVSTLPKGIHFIEVVAGNNISRQKFIKQ